MVINPENLSEKGKKFRDLSSEFFGQIRTDFLSAMDKEGAVMNLRDFLEKLTKIDVSSLDAKSKIVFDKLILAPAKVDQLMSTAHQMIQMLAEKDKITYDQAKVLLAFSFSRLKGFVAKIEKELPGVLDEIAKL